MRIVRLTGFRVALGVCLAASGHSAFAQATPPIRATPVLATHTAQVSERLSATNSRAAWPDSAANFERSEALARLTASYSESMRAGRSTHVWLGIGIGVLAGGALGLRSGLIHSRQCTSEACEGGPNFEPIADALEGGAIGGAIGGVAGALWKFIP